MTDPTELAAEGPRPRRRWWSRLGRSRQAGTSAAAASWGQARRPMAAIVIGFVVLAVLAAAVSIVLTPPFQTPDAFVQFDRAVGISYGQLVGGVAGNQAGGSLPTGVGTAEAPFLKLPFHYDRKVTAAEFRRADAATWGHGTAFVPFAATTEYPPVDYFPGALALVVARIFDPQVLVGYYLLEVVNAIFFIALVAWSLTFFRPIAALLLGAVALLPMEIALVGSPSTDGIIFALLCFVAAVVYRRTYGVAAERIATASPAPTGRVSRWGGIVVGWGWLELLAALALAAAVIPKPPYVLLVLIAGLPALRRRDRAGVARSVVGMAALVGTLTALWYRFGAKFQGAYRTAPKGTSISRQLTLLLNHPGSVVTIAANTLSGDTNFYWRSFVGDLGWLDTNLHGWVYTGAGAGLLVLLVLLVLDSSVDLKLLGVSVLTVLLAAAGVFAALYLDWTPVGSDIVQGVQGRYFLPLVPITLLGFGPARASLAAARTRIALGATVVVAMIWLETAGVCMALLGRFWLN